MTFFGGCIVYRPHFLDGAEADRIFAQLRDSIFWQSQHTRLFGRDVALPRLTAWYGCAPYRYANVTHTAQPFTPVLADLRERISQAYPEERFNSVLLNRYRDGNDSVAWHSDNEPELGSRPLIASLSLGGPRAFQIRSRDGDHDERTSLELEHGSLLVMCGRSQSDFEHRVPKRAPAAAVRERINLTFRYIRVERG